MLTKQGLKPAGSRKFLDVPKINPVLGAAARKDSLVISEHACRLENDNCILETRVRRRSFERFLVPKCVVYRSKHSSVMHCRIVLHDDIGTSQSTRPAWCIAFTWGSAKSATTSTTFIPVAFVNGS